MSRLASFAKRIPFIDALWSIASKMGITSALSAIFAVMSALFLTVWAWIWSNVAPWGLLLIFIGSAGLIAWAAEKVLAAILRARQVTAAQPIDRVALATEAESLCRQINSLVGEHVGPIQSAWREDCLVSSGSPLSRKLHNEAVGKLVEKYSERFAGHAWTTLHKAAKVVPVTRSDLFGIENGVRGESDILDMAQLLSKLAADLRYGVTEEVTHGR